MTQALQRVHYHICTRLTIPRFITGLILPNPEGFNPQAGWCGPPTSSAQPRCRARRRLQRVRVSAAAFANTVQYRVQPGDTLWDIARSHGVSVSSIREANAMDRKENVITEGEVTALHRFRLVLTPRAMQYPTSFCRSSLRLPMFLMMTPFTPAIGFPDPGDPGPPDSQSVTTGAGAAPETTPTQATPSQGPSQAQFQHPVSFLTGHSRVYDGCPIQQELPSSSNTRGSSGKTCANLPGMSPAERQKIPDLWSSPRSNVRPGLLPFPPPSSLLMPILLTSLFHLLAPFLLPLPRYTRPVPSRFSLPLHACVPMPYVFLCFSPCPQTAHQSRETNR